MDPAAFPPAPASGAPAPAPATPPDAARPSRAALVVNSRSGRYDAAAEQALVDAFKNAGLPLAKVIRLPDDALPDGGALAAWGVDMLAVWAGDGTINAVTDQAGDWPGAVLVLPGGTLNLLSKTLHGDRDPAAIIADVGAGAGTAAPIPTVVGEGAGEGLVALVSIVAGSTTAWADVRAALRDRDIGAMVATTRDALAATLSDPDVRIDGVDTPYQAFNLSPDGAAFSVIGFVADGAGDLVRHGAAWISGDFRDGPHVELGQRTHATVTADATLGLQVDGELIDWDTHPATAGNPPGPDGGRAPKSVGLRAGRTSVRFWRTLPPGAPAGDAA